MFAFASYRYNSLAAVMAD